MSFVAAAVGGAVVGAVGQAYAANKGAKAQQAASNSAIAEQRRQYDQTREDNMPWLEAGRGALDRQNAFLAGDYSLALNSPDYLAARDMGLDALEAGATARGNLWGGGTDADRIRFGGQMATQAIDNWWAKNAGLSGTGQQTAGQLGAFGQQTAGNIGNAMIGQGQARASAYAGQANAFANLANQGVNAYGYSKGWF